MALCRGLWYDPVESFFILWIVILGGMLRTWTGSVALQLHSYTPSLGWCFYAADDHTVELLVLD